RRAATGAEPPPRHQTAIQAARHLEDRLGQANALTDLADVQRLTGDYPAAAQAQEQALGIYRDLSDRLGQANALTDLGMVRRLTGEFPGASRSQEEDLAAVPDPREQPRPTQAPPRPGGPHAAPEGLP